ncbi:hypothetical protein AB4323_21540 [Vibrio sp. 10N.261.52.C11]|uniref:hypothetical protein n=1 Tax=Vibrio TaxID=662 RepID=UPI001B318156|nr:hypothetical protein [Vibrio crassostreae]
MNLSEILALLSMIVAFLAYRHAVNSSLSTSKLMNEISQEHLKLGANVALIEASQKYVVLLNEVNQEFEKIVKELSSSALKANTNIGEIFDRYDVSRGSSRYLRHCFHSSTVVVREAYDKELTYQTGLNLTSRIRTLKFIKENVSQYNGSKKGKSIFSFLKKEAKPETAEEYINSSVLFWDSLTELYERIPNEKESKIFEETLDCLAEFRCLHEEKRGTLKSLEERLELAIKENALEMFNLRDVPNLGNKFYRVKGDIDRYHELYFPDFYSIESVSITDGIAYSLYAGSITFIASQHFMWGKI